eukprot:16449232-Heterocapsa_arctica.AAC.1
MRLSLKGLLRKILGKQIIKVRTMLRTGNKNSKTIKQRKADLRTSDQSEKKLIKSTKGAMNKQLLRTDAMSTEPKI